MGAPIRLAALCALLAAVCAPCRAQPLRVATLNCEWLMRPGTAGSAGPGIDRPRDGSEYAQKVENLAWLLFRASPDLVGLQEIGDMPEAADIAGRLGMRPFFVQGRDTATGQDVAAAAAGRGEWGVRATARIGCLDAVISKHMVLTLGSSRGRTIHAVVVHLLRPVGLSRRKHQGQCAELARWLGYVASVRPSEGFVVLGDLNSTEAPPGPLGLPGWTDAAGLLAQPPGRWPLDRIIASPNLAVESPGLESPPLPRGASDSLRRVWTDHPCMAATVRFRGDPP